MCCCPCLDLLEIPTGCCDAIFWYHPIIPNIMLECYGCYIAMAKDRLSKVLNAVIYRIILACSQILHQIR